MTGQDIRPRLSDLGLDDLQADGVLAILAEQAAEKDAWCAREIEQRCRPDLRWARRYRPPQVDLTSAAGGAR